MFSIFRADTEEERQKKSEEWVATVKKEIEPFLADAGPFFGGSKKMTLAEVRANIEKILWTRAILMSAAIIGQHRSIPPPHLCLLKSRRPPNISP